MGYNTTFDGELKITPSITDDHRDEVGAWIDRHRGCYWEVDELGMVQWDGSEKFYDYVYWLEAMVNECFIPLGYALNGEIDWCGEEHGDLGTIYVKDNVMEAVEHYIVKPRPSWEQQS